MGNGRRKPADAVTSTVTSYHHGVVESIPATSTYGGWRTLAGSVAPRPPVKPDAFAAAAVHLRHCLAQELWSRCRSCRHAETQQTT